MKNPATHGTSEREGKVWGKGERANMPQKEKMTDFPKVAMRSDGDINDTITGVDKSVTSSIVKSKRFLSNQH